MQDVLISPSPQRANILKEVQIMRGLHHPSIVKLLSFSESEDHFFLVLERMYPSIDLDILNSINKLGVVMEGGELFHQM